ADVRQRILPRRIAWEIAADALAVITHADELIRTKCVREPAHREAYKAGKTPSKRIARNRRRRGGGARRSNAELAQQSAPVQFQPIVAVGESAEIVRHHVEGGARTAIVGV